MTQFSYKNRIAFNYIVITGVFISVVFFVIYQIIYLSVHNHIDEHMKEEVSEHLNEIKIDLDNSYLIQVDQWRETENNVVDVNSVFVQFLDINNELIDKSPNLKNLELKLHSPKFDNQYIDTNLNGNPIRQIQVPLVEHNKIVGHLLLAMSLENTVTILQKVQYTLFISLPLVLFLLFLTARYIAGRSIKPVQVITETSGKITKDNLKTRIILPNNRDELYVLSKTINDLLDRIENAVDREKQFTSDASHELRTPLAVVKGTLEVLIRKPRTQSEYEEKINYSIRQVDRLNNLVDQLLLLARFENQNPKDETVFLNALILDTLTLYSEKINSKKIVVKHNFIGDFIINSDNYLISIIIGNIISNALKYSHDTGEILISIVNENNQTICKVSDNGIGIAKEDLELILNPFFRSDSSSHPEVKGSGLGLSIVKRLAELLHIDFKIESEIGIGTTVTFIFDQNNKLT
ncbi:HAMP domain-containing sensor histidine kinase [Flavobacterium sp.]|uniref:sensor histidine kinase n=1 Tax=Flavobacterium sp. TaxID=239 RepID=UPI0032652B57